MQQYQFGTKTNEEVKQEVLLDLYHTGRINGNYFDVKSNSKKNPIKAYINKFLSRNNIDDVNLDLCNECYQLTFQHLFKKPAEKIVEILKESPKKLTATALRIVINNCFSIKPDSKNSGLFHNILEKSGHTHNAVQISTSELFDEDSTSKTNSVILFEVEEEDNEFNNDFGFSVEQLVDRLSNEDREFFYFQLQKQNVGKPSKATLEKRQKLYDWIFRCIVRHNSATKYATYSVPKYTSIPLERLPFIPLQSTPLCYRN